MTCESCGGEIQIGSWPFCPDHQPVSPGKGFEPYFDHGLGQVVTGYGDIQKACRPHWQDDHVIHIQPRDNPPGYYRELNERRAERAERERKHHADR